MGRSCSAPATQIAAAARMPALASKPPGAGAPLGHRERRDPGQDGEAGQFRGVCPGGGVSGRRAGQAAKLMWLDPRVQPDGRSRQVVGLLEGNEQRQGGEHSGQRMREPRADRDPGRAGGDDQQQPGG